MKGMPSRDDLVAIWIKRCRGRYPERSEAWGALDDLLDRYRLHADTGTPLSLDAREGPEAPGQITDLERDHNALMACWRAEHGEVLVEKTDRMLEEEAAVFERHGELDVARVLRSGIGQPG